MENMKIEELVRLVPKDYTEIGFGDPDAYNDVWQETDLKSLSIQYDMLKMDDEYTTDYEKENWKELYGFPYPEIPSTLEIYIAQMLEEGKLRIA